MVKKVEVLAGADHRSRIEVEDMRRHPSGGICYSQQAMENSEMFGVEILTSGIDKAGRKRWMGDDIIR